MLVKADMFSLILLNITASTEYATKYEIFSILSYCSFFFFSNLQNNFNCHTVYNILRLTKKNVSDYINTYFIVERKLTLLSSVYSYIF